jgi:hypothetical protein
MQSKKTTTDANREFIKAAHDASQVYVELANQTFKDDCTLSGENTDKLKSLEDARMYVDSSKNSS